MTIKELEARCGLDRATIRFYEKEGLLAPARKANGYRDYSEEDALALEKIAFLRQLGLSLEIIRAIQQGELPLGVALERQDEQLLARQIEAQQALRISRAIRAEGASYQTLIPAKYKNMISHQSEKTVALSKSIRVSSQDISDATVLWGRRAFARILDMNLYGLPSFIIQQLLLRISYNNEWSSLFTLLSSILCMMVFEPLFLMKFGTTPGKYCMGLKIKYVYWDCQDKPTFSEALLRTGYILIRGFGLFFIPTFVWCLAKSFERAKNGQIQPWDRGYIYSTDKSVLWQRIIRSIVLCGSAIACATCILLTAQRPPNLGLLTTTQYVENVNDLMHYQTGNGCFLLEEKGSWFHHGCAKEICHWKLGLYPMADFEIVEDSNGHVEAVEINSAGKNQKCWDVALMLDALLLADRDISLYQISKTHKTLNEAYATQQIMDCWVNQWHIMCKGSKITIEYQK